MDKILKKIVEDKPYWLYDVLSLLSAIITIVTAILTVTKAIIEVNALEDGTYNVSYNKLLAFLCVTAILLCSFCRSKNSDKNRKANDAIRTKSIKISDNTDFYDILDEKSENTNSYFYQGNLPQYDKDLKKAGKRYRNTTEDYDIVGFLCVDSLSTNAFRNTNFDKENNTNIVKSFAAEIYIILNKYNFYLQRINGGH